MAGGSGSVGGSPELGTSIDWLSSGSAWAASCFFWAICACNVCSSTFRRLSVLSSTRTPGGAWKANSSGFKGGLSWTFE